MGKKKDEWKNEDDLWYQQAGEAAQALAERPAFSYAPESDPLWQAAKDQALRLGRRAMEDTMGRAAGLSGGFASSYAQLAGQQAYDRQLSALAARLPDYEARARSAYDKQTDALHDALSTALGLYDRDYQSWLDRQKAEISQEQWEREFADDRERWDAKFADDRARWEAEYDQRERKQAGQLANTAASQAASAQEKERSYAYRMAMLALQQGLTVSDALLRTAGIDKAYAETIRRYYARIRP